MHIDSTHRDRMLAHLRATAGESKPCTLCGEKLWRIGEQIYLLPEFNPNLLSPPASVYPVVPLTCLKCGNTLFLNALLIGALDPQVKEASDASH
jgi:hypothetical protein